jgi:hypothetical protein
MALGPDRSAEHLELAEHLIVLTLCSTRQGLAWRGLVGQGARSRRSLIARPSRFPRQKAAMRCGRASVNSDRHKSNRRGRHETRLSADAGQNRRQASGGWKQKRDRYLALAQAAASAGDAVEAENYYQHADHYFRLMQQRA